MGILSELMRSEVLKRHSYYLEIAVVDAPFFLGEKLKLWEEISGDFEDHICNLLMTRLQIGNRDGSLDQNGRSDGVRI